MLLRHAEDCARRRQRAFFFATSAPQTPSKAVVFKRSVRTMCDRLVLCVYVYIYLNNIHRIIIYVPAEQLGFFFSQNLCLVSSHYTWTLVSTERTMLYWACFFRPLTLVVSVNIFSISFYHINSSRIIIQLPQNNQRVISTTW